jgi:hypothetical protein
MALALLASAACSSAPPATATPTEPEVESASPAVGAVVMATPGSVPTFQITVSDANGKDDLHVRWIADFPPFTAETRILVDDELVTHRNDGQPLVQSVSVTPSCAVHDLAKIAQHQIMAVVADRAFDDSQLPAGAPVDLTRLRGQGGLEVTATWTLDLECP